MKYAAVAKVIAALAGALLTSSCAHILHAHPIVEKVKPITAPPLVKKPGGKVPVLKAPPVNVPAVKTPGGKKTSPAKAPAY